MPAGHYDQDEYVTPDRHYNSDQSHNANDSTASILKSVKAQEVQFERLTRELEAERQSVARQEDQYRAISDTASMNSISSADDSYNWNGTYTDSRLEDTSLGNSKMSSHLLDSCLRELEDRGALNSGENNMEGRYDYQGYRPYDDNEQYNYSHMSNGGNPHMQMDERSPHGSRISLQSGGSNRRIDPKVPGSMGSLHREQPHDNYASFSSLTRPPYNEDIQGSPRGDTPTRFNSYPQQPYSSGHMYDENSPRYSMASNDSFQRQQVDPYSIYDPRDVNRPQSRNSYDRLPADQSMAPYGSSSHMDNDPRYGDSYGQPALRDQYGEPHNNYDPHNDSQVSDSFYRDSPERNDSYRRNYPYNDGGYEGGPPHDNRFQDPSFVDDRFRGPENAVPDNYPGSNVPEEQYVPHNEGYRDMPHHEQYRDMPPDEQYGDMPPDDRFRDMSLNDPHQDRQQDVPSPGDRYGDMPQGDRYGDMPQGDRYGDLTPGDRYGDPPQGDRYGDIPQEDRYGDQPPGDRYSDQSPRDRYGDHPPEQYSGPPTGERYLDYAPQDSFDNRPPEDRFQTYGDYDDQPYRKHEGLPQVHSDPFADDPFQQKTIMDGEDERYRGPPHVEDRYREEDPYSRRSPSPSPGSDRYGTYNERPPQYGDDKYSNDGRVTPQQALYDEEMRRSDARNVGAPPRDNLSDGKQPPSELGDGSSWRPPDLEEIIDYLSHPSDNVKANAAAYLQHLCFSDDKHKTKARELDGIPPLIDLLRSDHPEIQRNACGALKNLSFGKGRAGLDNKKAIENAGGITYLIRLLRKAQDEDVKELVTGILWNLSSCEDLKGKIIAEGLPDIVSRVIVPYSGWERRGLMQSYEPWTTVYRNATGIIRNLSSAHKDDELKGYDTRNKLRECNKLVRCLIYTLKISKENNDRENKPVENCTCALRNLSFRIQEVAEQDFYRKRTMTLKKRQQPEKESVGCFGGSGGGGKKKPQQSAKKGKPDLNQNAELILPPGAQEFEGLWQPEVVSLYLDILKESSNPVTLEAAAGAIQNLTACYWKYADDTRSLVRKAKGLPALVGLLGQERDSVVCHSALALRNLAIDDKNKELIGSYALKQIILTLPMENQNERVPDKTVCAVVALLHEVVRNSVDFAQLLVREGGIKRLMFIKYSRGLFLKRTKDHTQTLLTVLWEFKSLHPAYATNGLTEAFVKEPIKGVRPADSNPSNSAYGTMSRPMESHGYDDHTLSAGRPMTKPYQPMNGRMEGFHGKMVQGHSNPAMNVDEPYYDDRRRDEIPMTDLGPGYAPIDERRERKPPTGGVALFPGLQQQPPQQQPPQAQPQTMPHGGEPLYAQVNKNKRRDELGPPSPNHVMLDAGGQQGGADSWV